MKKILVTGGTGYIGSHTVVSLLESGYKVSIIDNLSNSHVETLGKIEKITGKKPDFYNIDLCDKNALAAFFNENHDFDGVIHFAALKSVAESMTEPLRYHTNNVGSLLNLLEAMTSHKIKNLIFSSSCVVYGNPEKLPVTESSPIGKPESTYASTKIISESILKDVSSSKIINAVALRYFNPVGAHPSGLIGEEPIGIPNNLMPILLGIITGKREKITIFGNDYPTKDGTCVRDYIHVMDLANAHLVAMERLLDGKQKNTYEFFNIGTGLGTSTLEMVKEFERVSGKKTNYDFGARRQGDMVEIYADTAYANKELGWSAKENLESMLSSAIKYIVTNFKN
jgi:UDP-glucose 4-epimerase